ncbi:MAG: hypothetical protein A3J76_06015 [Candidatus Moranbacteria bacterium RBG_13_45_13]|nr:MAG: hypothetical protein A3J76_06015 [Candidatus Moranbacteria bacterium RBG_13_45_13]
MVKKFLVVLIILLPLQFALNIGENFDLVTTRVLIPILFLLWLMKSFARKKVWLPRRAEVWLVASFLFLSWLSLFLGRDAEAGWRKLLYFFSIFPVFFVTADIAREEKWQKRAAAAVIASGTIAAAIALVQFSLPFVIGLGKSVKIWEGLVPYALGHSFGRLVAANSSWLVNIGGETRMRAFGFFPDPHNFSFFVNLCFFAGLGYFFWQKKIMPRIWVGVGLAFMLIAVVFSYSRGAYLGLLAGIIFFAVIFLKRSGLLGKVFVVVGIAAILVTIFNSNIISQRMVSSFDPKEGSNAERYKNWVQAVELARDYPLGGVGLGNYARAIDPASQDRSSVYAHNLFLDIAAETGIINAAVFFLLIAVSVWRNVRSKHMLNLGLAAGLIGFLAHSIFDTALYSPQVLTMLLVIIALGLSDNAKFKIQSSK